MFALAVSGSTVYAGGDFNRIGGRNCHGLAALDPATGLATSWDPGAGMSTGLGIQALAVRGSTVYAGGRFVDIGGQRCPGAAALDSTTGLCIWNSQWNVIGKWVSALAPIGYTLYVGGSAGNLAAVDAGTGIAMGWKPTLEDPSFPDVAALALSGRTVYVGGHFTGAGGESRSNLAAIDAVTGVTTDWNPGADGYVRVLLTSGTTMYVGGEFTTIGGQSSRGLAAFAIEDLPVPTLVTRFEAEPTAAGVQIRWQFQQPELVASTTLERATNTIGPWTALTLASSRTGVATEALDANVADGATYLYRLTANLTDGTHATFGPISAATLAAVKVSGLTGIVPNPVATNARIDFALARAENVRISVVDVTGREAARLADGPMAAGTYSLIWDGRKANARVPAGVYYVRWNAGGKTMNRKLVML